MPRTCIECPNTLHPKGKSLRCRSCAAKESSLRRQQSAPLEITPVPAETLAKVRAWRQRQSNNLLAIGVRIETPAPFYWEDEFELECVSTYGKGARLGVSTCPRCSSRMSGDQCGKCRWKAS